MTGLGAPDGRGRRQCFALQADRVSRPVQLVLTAHALKRMQPLQEAGRGGTHGLQYADVRYALMHSRNCRSVNSETSARWKVDGPDDEGDDVTLVVAIEDGVIVITVM